MRNTKNRKSCVVLSLSVAVALMMIAGLRVSDGYTGDATGTELDDHSSFHYEMTRVLMAASGFNAADSELVAVVDMATDDGRFKGYSGTAIYLENTLRTGSNAIYYHFARRGPNYPSAVFEGASSDTCDYFAGSTKPDPNSPCPRTEAGYLHEMDRIEDWALRGLNTLAASDGTRPTFASAANGPFVQVDGQSLESLGIFLHVLGDSYSHEKCMMDGVTRMHANKPSSCKLKWHRKSEFGSAEGVPFTKAAGLAVWQAINSYRLALRLPASTWDAASFVESFVTMKKADARLEYANDMFITLTR